MNDKKISLIEKIIVGVIAIIALFYYISIMKNTEDASGAIDGMLRFTYVILVLTIVATVWVWLKEIITHPAKLKQTFLFVGLFAVVVLIAKYVLASSEPVTYYPNIHVDANTSNWVDTGLYTFYILAFVAIALMFLSPVLSFVAEKKSLGQEEELIEEGDDNKEA